MILQVHMTPWQYLDGYADRIGELLGEGSFRCCRGRWRVLRRLVAIDVHGKLELRRVAFQLEPLDGAARRIAACAEQG